MSIAQRAQNSRCPTHNGLTPKLPHAPTSLSGSSRNKFRRPPAKSGPTMCASSRFIWSLTASCRRTLSRYGWQPSDSSSESAAQAVAPRRRAHAQSAALPADDPEPRRSRAHDRVRRQPSSRTLLTILYASRMRRTEGMPAEGPDIDGERRGSTSAGQGRQKTATCRSARNCSNSFECPGAR